MPKTHQLKTGTQVDLADCSTSGSDFHDERSAAEKEFKQLRRQFIEQQHAWYAEGRRKLLIVLQAMDAGGKDGTIRLITRGVNPQGVRVTSFKKPSSRELSRDYLWRVHRFVPRAGMIGIFNRSHYEDVLVVRVNRIVPESVWRARYEQINQFEKLLSETGTTILKFFLHISKEEQKERFQDRLDEPDKHWKFSLDDLEKRKQWEDYMAAYEAALTRCTTSWAPWYVIPADQKWYRNLAIMRVIVDTVNGLNPQFPEAADGLDSVVIE